jgi:hypothetical protein
MKFLHLQMNTFSQEKFGESIYCILLFCRGGWEIFKRVFNRFVPFARQLLLHSANWWRADWIAKFAKQPEKLPIFATFKINKLQLSSCLMTYHFGPVLKYLKTKPWEKYWNVPPVGTNLTSKLLAGLISWDYPCEFRGILLISGEVKCMACFKFVGFLESFKENLQSSAKPLYFCLLLKLIRPPPPLDNRTFQVIITKAAGPLCYRFPPVMQDKCETVWRQ